MNEQRHRSTPASVRSRRSRLAATTALGAGASALMLLAGAPARAENECGAATAGMVTCTAAGNPYAAGVTYMSAAGLTLDTTADAQITAPVSIDASANGASDVTFDHAGAVTAATDGRNAVDLSGNDVSATISGTIANTGAFVPGTFDDDGNPLTLDRPAGGLAVTATGAVSITNDGAISISDPGSAGIKITTTGDVSIAGTGSVVANDGIVDGNTVSGTGIEITSTAGGVSGTIANVTSNSGTAVNIQSQGTVALQLDVVVGDVNITNGAFDADGNPVSDPAGDVSLAIGTISAKTTPDGPGQSNVSVTNNVGGIDFGLSGVLNGSADLSGSGPVRATIDGSIAQDGGLSLSSATDAATAAVNGNVAGTVSVTAATSADVTVAPRVAIAGDVSATANDGGTSARVSLGTGVTVDGGVAVTGITAANLDIGEGTTIGGDTSLTTSDGAASIVVSRASSIGGGVSATAQNDGTSARIEVASSATVGGGLNAQGNTTAAILIDRGGAAATNGGSVSLGSTAGGTFVNQGIFGTEANPGSVSASGGNTIVTNSGLLAGSFFMTGGGNRVANSGTLVLGSGNSGSIGDSGENSFVNAGVVKLPSRQNAGLPFINSLAGLTQFSNSGTIDLRNQTGGDVIAISGTADAPAARFVGSGGSTVLLDVFYNQNGATADKLTATGAITGSTTVILSTTGGASALTPRTIVVQGGTGTQASAITLVAPANTPLVNYSTSFDPSTNSFALVGTPGDGLVHLARVNEGAQQLWYRAADTSASHFSEIRDARFGGYAKGAGRLWGTMYGQTARRRGSLDAGAFGVARSASAAYRQDTFGAQLGFDVAGYDKADGALVGITAGYQSSKINFERSSDSTRFNVANAGVLIGYQTGGLFVNALGQFSYYWAKSRSPDAGYRDRFTGNSYGGQAEFGYRIGKDRLFVEPVATIAYVRTNLDTSRIGGIDVDFGLFQGLRGKAGARIGSRLDLGGGATVIAYAQGNYVHEFKGDDATRFDDNLVSVSLRNRAIPDYGEGKIGFSAGSTGGVTGFVEGFGTAGRGYRGGGGRAGIRVPM